MTVVEPETCIVHVPPQLSSEIVFAPTDMTVPRISKVPALFTVSTSGTPENCSPGTAVEFGAIAGADDVDVGTTGIVGTAGELVEDDVVGTFVPLVVIDVGAIIWYGYAVVVADEGAKRGYTGYVEVLDEVDVATAPVLVVVCPCAGCVIAASATDAQIPAATPNTIPYVTFDASRVSNSDSVVIFIGVF